MKCKKIMYTQVRFVGVFLLNYNTKGKTMKKYISCLITLILGVGVTLGAANKLPVKVEKYQKLPRLVEPTNFHTDIEDGKSQPVIHRRCKMVYHHNSQKV